MVWFVTVRLIRSCMHLAVVCIVTVGRSAAMRAEVVKPPLVFASSERAAREPACTISAGRCFPGRCRALWMPSRSAPVMMLKESDYLAHTRAWFERIVLGLSLCPWARPVHEAGQIRYSVSSAKSPEELFYSLVDELRILAANPDEVETTIIIHPSVLTKWEDYVEWLQGVEDIFEEQGLDETYQLVGFHPDFVFGGTDARDASNWVNRSPYPMVHILRQDSVTQAVTDKPGLQVGLMNKHNLRSLAVKGKLQELLQGTPGVEPAAIANIRVCQEASGRPLDGEANYLYYDDTETDT